MGATLHSTVLWDIADVAAIDAMVCAKDLAVAALLLSMYAGPRAELL